MKSNQITSLVIFVLMCRGAPVFAQEKTKAPESGSAAPDTIIAEPAISDTSASARIFLDKIEVFGTVAKPQALFILPGSDPTVDGLKIERSFFKEIFRPVEWDGLKKSLRPVRQRIRW